MGKGTRVDNVRTPPVGPGGPGGVMASAILLGDQGTGKTSLVARVHGGTRVAARMLCSANCMISFSLPVPVYRVNRTVHLSVFDTGGQEKFRSLTASYYRGAHGCLLMFDVTKEATFSNVSYWLNDLKKYSPNPDISILLVGTRCHVTSEERQVTSERAQKFAESEGLPYMEVSAEEGVNVTEVFERLADLILDSITRDRDPSVVVQQPNKIILESQKPKKGFTCSC